jgi:hypothetical protein
MSWQDQLNGALIPLQPVCALCGLPILDEQEYGTLLVKDEEGEKRFEQVHLECAERQGVH